MPLDIGALRLKPILLITGISVALHSWAQSTNPEGKPREFDVASIRLSKSNDTHMVYRLAPGGVFIAENVTTRFLIKFAFDVQDFQIIGGPDWLGSERYNLRAKAEGVSNPYQMKPMLQTLLADRFKLAMHNETKGLPIYDLITAKRGSKLQAAGPGSCYVLTPNVHPPAPRAGESDAYLCGKIYFPAPNRLLARRVQMSTFADGLSTRVGRTVVDKTGDGGTYDVDLQWNPDQASSTVQPAEPDQSTDPDSTVPSIIMGLQDQLGLSLRSDKGQVVVKVIDLIQRPTDN